jgi:transcription elongation factor Elf1
MKIETVPVKCPICGKELDSIESTIKNKKETKYFFNCHDCNAEVILHYPKGEN